MTADDDLVVIDLDDCRDPKTGTLTATAEALAESFSTHTVASVSGTGVHLFLRGQWPTGAGNKKRLNEVCVEVYADRRFIVMTDTAIRDVPVRACQQELERLHRLLWPQQSSTDARKPTPRGSASRLDDDELIARASAAKGGEEFAALWAGDRSGYPSPSEADYALVRSLAWRSACDREQVARLWLRSGLYREKLDREDYRERTIDRACEYVAAGGGGYSGRAPQFAARLGAEERTFVKDDLKYFRLSPRIWEQEWSESAKTLAIYLLCNRHRNTEGLYRLPKAYILGDLGWARERLAEPFAELLEAGFIEYDDKTSVVFVAKALRWQPPDNPNQRKHAVKLLQQLPETPLFDEFLRAAEEYAPDFAEQLRERMPERFA